MTGPRGQTDHMFIPATPAAPGGGHAMQVEVDGTAPPIVRLKRGADEWPIAFPVDGRDRSFLTLVGWSLSVSDARPALYIVLGYTEGSATFVEVWQVLNALGKPLLAGGSVAPVLKHQFSDPALAGLLAAAYFEDTDETDWLVPDPTSGLIHTKAYKNAAVVSNVLLGDGSTSGSLFLARRGGEYVAAVDSSTVIGHSAFNLYTSAGFLQTIIWNNTNPGLPFFVEISEVSERGGKWWFVAIDGGQVGPPAIAPTWHLRAIPAGGGPEANFDGEFPAMMPTTNVNAFIGAVFGSDVLAFALKNQDQSGALIGTPPWRGVYRIMSGGPLKNVRGTNAIQTPLLRPLAGLEIWQVWGLDGA